MTKISKLHRRWSKDRATRRRTTPSVKSSTSRGLIQARRAAGLSQSQLAKRMNTSQSYIAGIEGGKVRPSTNPVERFAEATRTRLRIVFEPSSAK